MHTASLSPIKPSAMHSLSSGTLNVDMLCSSMIDWVLGEEVGDVCFFLTKYVECVREYT